MAAPQGTKIEVKLLERKHISEGARRLAFVVLAFASQSGSRTC